jgi:myosin heavy subunit
MRQSYNNLPTSQSTHTMAPKRSASPPSEELPNKSVKISDPQDIESIDLTGEQSGIGSKAADEGTVDSTDFEHMHQHTMAPKRSASPSEELPHKAAKKPGNSDPQEVDSIDLPKGQSTIITREASEGMAVDEHQHIMAPKRSASPSEELPQKKAAKKLENSDPQEVHSVDLPRGRSESISRAASEGMPDADAAFKARIEELEQENKRLEKEKKTLEQLVDSSKSNGLKTGIKEALAKTAMEVENKWKDKIADQKDDFEAKMARKVRDWKNKLETKHTNYKKKINELRDEHKETLEYVKEKHMEKAESTKKSCEDKLEKYKKEHRKALDEAKAAKESFAQRERELKGDFAEMKRKLKEEMKEQKDDEVSQWKPEHSQAIKKANAEASEAKKKAKHMKIDKEEAEKLAVKLQVMVDSRELDRLNAIAAVDKVKEEKAELEKEIGRLKEAARMLHTEYTEKLKVSEMKASVADRKAGEYKILMKEWKGKAETHRKGIHDLNMALNARDGQLRRAREEIERLKQ